MGKTAWPCLRRRGDRQQIAIITITISAETPTTAGCGCFCDVGGHTHVGIGDSKYPLGRAAARQGDGANRDPYSALCDGTFSSFATAAHKTSVRVHWQTAQVLGASCVDPRSRGSATATATAAEKGQTTAQAQARCWTRPHVCGQRGTVVIISTEEKAARDKEEEQEAPSGRVTTTCHPHCVIAAAAA